jgi:conjugative transfer signal peptidase TraF
VRWRHYALGAGVGGLLFLLMPHKPYLILNISASMPRGAYLLQSSADLKHGDIVLAPLDAQIAALAVSRGYLPEGLPIIKPVVALGGDVVCLHNNVVVNGEVLTSTIQATDSQGRELPHIEGCVLLDATQVFLLSTTHARSLDSRYFGPIDRRTILGKVKHLWSW